MKKSLGIWAIIAVNAYYVLSIIVGIVSQSGNIAKGSALTLEALAIDAVIIVIFLISTYELFTLGKHVMGWFIAAFVVAIGMKLLALGLALAAYSSTLGVDKILSSFSSGFIFVLAIWIGSFTYLRKFTKNPQFAEAQVMADDKRGKKGLLIALMVAAVILGIVPTMIYQNYLLPRSYDTMVQVDITDMLSNAMLYSLTNNPAPSGGGAASTKSPTFGSTGRNYAGFKPTVRIKTPDCSGPLVVNVSPDGNTIAVFGKSCTAPVYFCETASTNSFENVTFGHSMATVPVSAVNSTKYDCK